MLSDIYLIPVMMVSYLFSSFLSFFFSFFLSLCLPLTVLLFSHFVRLSLFSVFVVPAWGEGVGRVVFDVFGGCVFRYINE